MTHTHGDFFTALPVMVSLVPAADERQAALMDTLLLSKRLDAVLFNLDVEADIPSLYSCRLSSCSRFLVLAVRASLSTWPCF